MQTKYVIIVYNKCPLENVLHDANMAVIGNHDVEAKNEINVAEIDGINPVKNIVTLPYTTSMGL